MTVESSFPLIQQPELRSKTSLEVNSVKPTPQPRLSLTSSPVDDYDVKLFQPPPLKPRTKFYVTEKSVEECIVTPCELPSPNVSLGEAFKRATSDYRKLVLDQESLSFDTQSQPLPSIGLSGNSQSIAENTRDEDDEVTFL